MWSSLVTGKLANLLIAMVNVILVIFNTRAVNTNQPQVDLTDYTLTFEDEFDGELNRAVWTPHNFNGLRKGGWWDENQAYTSDGNLIIKTEYKEDGRFGSGWYTAGICTDKSFRQAYGYFECRCKLPKGKGLWSAFWLMNGNVNLTEGNGRKGSEIDVFESPFGYMSGKPSWKVTSNIHFNGYDLKTRYQNVVISQLDNDPYENFNTYGLLWTEDEYVYYVNGYEVARSSYGGVSQEPEYMILSCEVDGAAATPTYGWSGIITSNPEGNSFTSEFVVDYVRVYSAK